MTDEWVKHLGHWLTLQQVPGIGPVQLFRMLEVMQPAQILDLPVSDLKRIGLRDQQINALKRPDTGLIESCIHWAEQPEQWILSFDDERYPPLLRQIPAPPPILFIKGDPACLNLPQLAIVGSRRPTQYGRSQARHFAEELSQSGLIITTGLASGIDACAHRGALSHGKTIAVQGCGLDLCYPNNHRELAKQVENSGCLVSELLPWQPPLARNFPRRNRIISGLSLGVLVIEAAIKSGSLITARYALEQGKDVFALPGSVLSPVSEGAHNLIRQGAILVSKPDHILVEIPFSNYRLKSGSKSCQSSDQEGGQLLFDPLLDSVDFEVTSIDEIASRSQLPVEQLVTKLVEFEMAGWIATVPGGYVKQRRD